MADYLIRGTAAGGQVRVFGATTKDLVEKARESHNTSPVATAAFDSGSHDGEHDEKPG